MAKNAQLNSAYDAGWNYYRRECSDSFVCYALHKEVARIARSLYWHGPLTYAFMDGFFDAKQTFRDERMAANFA